MSKKSYFLLFFSIIEYIQYNQPVKIYLFVLFNCSRQMIIIIALLLIRLSLQSAAYNILDSRNVSRFLPNWLRQPWMPKSFS
jgi:hypothetical protein